MCTCSYMCAYVYIYIYYIHVVSKQLGGYGIRAFLPVRSMKGQIKFMKEVVPWLEQEPAIEKYAWLLGYQELLTRARELFHASRNIDERSLKRNHSVVTRFSFLVDVSSLVKFLVVSQNVTGFLRGSATSPTSGPTASPIPTRMRVS